MTLTIDGDNLIIELSLGILNTYTIKTEFPIKSIRKLLDGRTERLSKVNDSEGIVDSIINRVCNE